LGKALAGRREPLSIGGRVAKNSQVAATRTADSSPTQAPARSEVPERAGLLLTTLILVAAVVNLPLAVANVALPDIGLHFNA
jgi:hypothetical protein